MGKSVAIVGAGLSGLYAGRLLSAANVDVCILEARDRIGGRILTVDEASNSSDDGFDLGPSWFWPQMQPSIGALIEELKLPSFPQNSEGDVIFERMSREPAHRYPGLKQEPQSMRLNGGSAALVRALAASLPRDSIQCGTCVTAMALTEGGVCLSIIRPSGREETLFATHVIAALPPRLLEAGIAFSPALEAATARLWRETPTWMAPNAKFFAIYDRPFWREAGLSGTAQSMVGPLMEIHDATTASGRAALFGFVGFGAPQRAAVGEAAIGRASIEQFARIFGPEALRPRATLYKDWTVDPLTAAPADTHSVGHPEAGVTAWIGGPWRLRLSLGGSETGCIEPGYLAGAIDAARRAVKETLERAPAVATQL